MSAVIDEPIRTSLATRAKSESVSRGREALATAPELRDAILSKLTIQLGQPLDEATPRDWYAATALALRDLQVGALRAGERARGAKEVCYISMEFLVGRRLVETLGNLGLEAEVGAALSAHGVSLDDLVALEPDPALGNGGLGRLAACFLESMATLGIPSIGYGIRYDHGLFQQSFAEGWQAERPDDWLSPGTPWEFTRDHATYRVGFGGEVITHPDGRRTWRPAEHVVAVAHDLLVVGWRGRSASRLRLWRARAGAPLELDVFNQGRHVEAQAEQVRAEAISKVLYPSDEAPEGRELRLRQEYFLTAASLQDLVARHLAAERDIRQLAHHAAMQLNDTHPALAIPELMRLLVDEHRLDWEEAWDVTTAVFSYTNHTLLPEALETWPAALLDRLLPRHLQIIQRINVDHFRAASRERQIDGDHARSLTLIDDHGDQRVHMGRLAFVGSHKVNGVSALHTRLMRETVFKDLHALHPDRIVNKTNGITFRRWLHRANPLLTRLLVDVAGERVLDDPERLRQLEPLADDPAFQAEFSEIRMRNKAALAELVHQRLRLEIDPAALFDVQIKRMHEYKRQLLNILETVALFHAIKENPRQAWTPRVKVFAGKAAPSYARAKLIIKLANDVADVVNHDAEVAGRLRIAFIPDYNVTLAEAIIPAADLSEQISTAGYEASGTGNMKLALNGALTIGTLDGANVEMLEHVGAENMFIFGLTAEEVEQRRGYDPRGAIANSSRLALALDSIATGLFSPNDRSRYVGLVEALRRQDVFMLMADFDAYWATQRSLDQLWLSPEAWWRKSILNTARMGWFSADRAIREYAKEIWGVASR